MLNKSIVFIFPYSLTAWDGERFGFNFLLDQGVNLRVLDLSALVSSRSDAGREFLKDSYIKKCNTYAELENEIKQGVQQKSVFIDNINGLTGFRLQTRKIFRLFKKYHVKYYIVEIGSLPLQSSAASSSRLLAKFKKTLKIKKLIVYLKWRAGKFIVNLQSKYFNLYQLPSRIFVGHTELLQSYLKQYGLTEQCVTRIHSFDYDRYLNWKLDATKNLLESAIKSQDYAYEKNICVFLDQGLTQHSDFGKSVSFCPVTAEKYYISMQNFFDMVEKITGLKIVIAVCPRVCYAKTPNIYGPRALIKNKTLELVAQSSLVLAHNSTAINFAVLFNKPLLLLKTKEMLNAYGFANVIDNMAAQLNVQKVCVENENEIKNLAMQNYDKWSRDFSAYKYKYVMSKNIPDKTTWQFVLDSVCEKN